MPPEAEHTNADLLRAYLRARPTPCPSCRFDLQGAPGDICPECGARLELALAADRPPFAATAVLVLLSAGLGACAVILAAAIFQSGSDALGSGRIRLRLDFDDAHAWIALVGLTIFFALLAFWLKSPAERGSHAGRVAMLIASALTLILLTLVLAVAG